jgi:hypothetical protein
MLLDAMCRPNLGISTLCLSVHLALAHADSDSALNFLVVILIFSCHLYYLLCAVWRLQYGALVPIDEV